MANLIASVIEWAVNVSFILLTVGGLVLIAKLLL